MAFFSPRVNVEINKIDYTMNYVYLICLKYVILSVGPVIICSPWTDASAIARHTRHEIKHVIWALA